MYLSQDYQLKPEHEVNFPYQSDSLLYGAGLYETLKTINQKPIALDLHLSRLKNSLDTLNIDYPLSEQRIFDQITELIKLNNHQQEQRIRINILLNKKPTLVIHSQDLVTTTPPKVIAKTLNSTRILPTHKTTSMIEQFLLKQQSETDQTIFEHIYTNSENLLTEGLKTDIIYQYENQLYTTSGPKLPSVSLKILESALKTKIPTRALRLQELAENNLSDIYLINSIIDIVRIDQLNSRIFSPKTKDDNTLQKSYLDYLQKTYG